MPEFDITLVEVRLLQDIPFYSRLRYLLRSRVPFPFSLFHYLFLSLIPPISLILCWYCRYWLRPNRCRCPCHRATRWCSAATFISSRPAALRRPRRRPCQDSRCRRHSTSIGLTTQWNRGTYVHAPPHNRRAICFASLYHTYRFRAGPFFLPPPIRDQSYHDPQARLKGEGRVGHSVALCRRQLFFLLRFFVVVGPSDLGLCPTGALHYSEGPSRVAC